MAVYIITSMIFSEGRHQFSLILMRLVKLVGCMGNSLTDLLSLYSASRTCEDGLMTQAAIIYAHLSYLDSWTPWLTLSHGQ
jgi:hypothetical protein